MDITVAIFIFIIGIIINFIFVAVVVVVVVVVFCRRHAFCGLRVEQVTSDLKGARDILKQLKELPPGA